MIYISTPEACINSLVSIANWQHVGSCILCTNIINLSFIVIISIILFISSLVYGAGNYPFAMCMWFVRHESSLSFNTCLNA